MAKSKKPTPQELYIAKKEREEAERAAFLPPGMINHGNTCFMNSTLQALLATPSLDSLFHFEELPPAAQASSSSAPIVAHRSPLLTNGHGVAGPHERDWEEGMSLGDSFSSVLFRAWAIRDKQRRESISPKEVLTAIGRKYDQYLDFAQQDAHEFLRQLLDAMRMEELDIIKKRQPPPPPNENGKSSRARSPAPNPRLSMVREMSFNTNADLAIPSAPVSQPADTSLNEDKPEPEPPVLTSDKISPEDRLVAFTDMLFGGVLASILVCDSCKKVSCGTEDFNDLSLPIKPEEYARGGASKKEKFKKFAQKLKLPKRVGGKDDTSADEAPAPQPSQSPSQHPRQLGVPVPAPYPIQELAAFRSSSTPPSPMRRDSEVANAMDAAFEQIHTAPRRRSIDASAANPSGLRGLVASAATTSSTSVGAVSLGEASASVSVSGASISGVSISGTSMTDASTVGTSVEDKSTPAISVVDATPSVASESRPVVVAEDFVTSGDESSKPERGRVGFVDPDKKDKDKDKDKDNWTKFTRRVSLAIGRKGKDEPSRSKERGRSRHSVDLSREAQKSSPPTRPASVVQPIPRPLVPNGVILDEAPSPLPPKVAAPTPPSPPATRAKSPMASLTGASVALLSPSPTKPTAIRPSLAVTPQRPPQPTKAEAAYLRRILADVPGFSTNPLAMLLGAASPTPDPVPSASSSPETRGAALWSRLAQLTTVEECLRMFTAVEVLEGENMVGCRRCWKLANGVYNQRQDSVDDGDDADSEDESDVEDKHKSIEAPSAAVTPNSAASTPSQSPVPAPIQASETSAAAAPPPPSPSYSAPNTISAPLPIRFDSVRSITSVSTNWSSMASESGIESPPESTADRKQFYLQPGAQGNGLPIPVISTTAPDSPNDRRFAREPGQITSPQLSGSLLAPSGRRKRAETVTSDSDSGIVEYEDGASAPSSAPDSPAGSPYNSREYLPLAPRPRSQSKSKSSSSVPKSKQVILRRAYKRYLIATPPPVLVIHLKRFQQISNMPAFSFGLNGFKKLDDFVAFPELLDLTPFLAPRKEEYGLKSGKGGKDGKDSKAKTGKAGSIKEQKCMYRLYAVIEHMGNMLGGHYIAYTALPDKPRPSSAAADGKPSSDKPHADSSHPDKAETKKVRQWAYISDTVSRLTTLDEVLKAKAYMCMYERV